MLTLASSTSAETYVQSMSGASTWTPAGNPYRVTVAVNFDDLTVEAGTLVQVSEEAQPAITVKGALVVRGTDANPVVFEKDGGSAGFEDTWGGIWADSFDVTGATFRDAYSALYRSNAVSPSRVTRSRFEGNLRGIENQGNLIVDQVTFSANGTAIVGNDFAMAEVVVSNVVVSGGNALVFYGESTSVSVTSSTFVGTFSPVFAQSPATIQNSIIVDSSFNASSARIDLTHSLAWNTPASTPVMEGEGVLRVEPAFVSETDLRLAAGSPCIDSGTPSGAPDHDLDGNPRPLGAGFDLGAFEHDPEAVGEAGAAGSDGADGGTSGTAGAGGSAGALATAGASGNATSSPGGYAGAGGAPLGGNPAAAGHGGAAGSSASGSTGSSGASGGAPSGANAGKVVRSSGCGCRTAGSSRDDGELLALTVLAGVMVLARRRAQDAMSV
jgi:hypothetical protein